MAEVNFDKLVKLVKAGKNQGQAAEALGITIGQLSMSQFCKAQVAADLYKTAPATPQSVKKLRDSERNRWELIAARTGLSVAAAKAAYEDAGGNLSTSFTGRGRNFSGSSNGRSTQKTGGARKTAGAGKKAVAGKSGGARKTTGASKKTSTARKTGGVVRNRNRSARVAASGNPS